MTGRAHALVNALIVAPAACVLAAFVRRAAGAGPAVLAGAGAAFGAWVLSPVA